MSWVNDLKASLNILNPNVISMCHTDGNMHVIAKDYNFSHISDNATISLSVFIDEYNGVLSSENMSIHVGLVKNSWCSIAIKIDDGIAEFYLNGTIVYKGISEWLSFKCYYSTISRLNFYEGINRDNIMAIHRNNK